MSIGMESWKTPSVELIEKVLFYHKAFTLLLPYYKNNEDKNVWIVKPASNARGHGIWVSNKLSDILPSNSQGLKGHDTVVMKYIENPLLYPVITKNTNNKDSTEYHKFDIRLWVLVTSIEPLEIYIFSSFYGRLCSFPYKLGDFSNTGIHLSNYSINKQFFQKTKKASPQKKDNLGRSYTNLKSSKKDSSLTSSMLATTRSVQTRKLGKSKSKTVTGGFRKKKTGAAANTS